MPYMRVSLSAALTEEQKQRFMAMTEDEAERFVEELYGVE